jgi:hypothetical protein
VVSVAASAIGEKENSPRFQPWGQIQKQIKSRRDDRNNFPVSAAPPGLGILLRLKHYENGQESRGFKNCKKTL